jgi:DNA-binding Lrp family transcriptional regulator
MIKEILKILEGDSRLTSEQIATMTGSSSTEVARLIKEAENNRTILKYKTVIDWDRVGEEQVWALIEVKITPQRDFGFDSIAERIYRFPEARTVYLVSGDYDLLVLAACRTMHEVADFIAQKLSPIEGVRGTTTHFVLKRYKEDGEILKPEGKGKRQQVIL